jgi:hypothetical protein
MVWTHFFLKQHEVSNTFQNGPNQNVRAGHPPLYTCDAFFRCVAFFYFVFIYRAQKLFKSSVLHFQKLLQVYRRGVGNMLPSLFFFHVLEYLPRPLPIEDQRYDMPQTTESVKSRNVHDQSRDLFISTILPKDFKFY